MSDVAATRSWLRYVAGGAVVAFAYLLLPRFAVLPDWLPRLLLYGAVSASAVACLVLGVRRYRPEQLLPWYLLLAGQVLYLLADLTFSTLHLVVGSQAYPSGADVLYLAHYPFVVAGVLALVRSRTPGSDRVSLNDAAIIATSLGVLSWVFLVAPAVLAHGVPVQMRMVSVAYPIMDLLVLAVAARLVVGVGFRPPPTGCSCSACWCCWPPTPPTPRCSSTGSTSSTAWAGGCWTPAGWRHTCCSVPPPCTPRCGR